MIRLWTFLSLLLILGIAERLWPQHSAAPRRRVRWLVNLSLGAIDLFCVRLLLPWLAVDAAVWAHVNNVGVLPHLHLSPFPAAVIAIAIFDLAIYAQHRLMHRIPFLWRLHRMHHTDLAIDVSSGVRFHPLEILLSMGIKIGIVLLLGATPAVVLVFEILLSSFSLVTHANIQLPVNFDRQVRRIFVTPDMHRIHHSIVRAEHDTNFGFHVSCWDRLFGSYLYEPQAAQSSMTLGLDRFRTADEQRLLALLRQPLDTP